MIENQISFLTRADPLPMGFKLRRLAGYAFRHRLGIARLLASGIAGQAYQRQGNQRGSESGGGWAWAVYFANP
jgi:hypothetical protein